MLILTPSGYRDIGDCQVGDPVCAFDLETGAPIINYIEKIDPVVLEEWQRWWNYPTNQDIPAFTSVRINGKWTLFREQSIWTTPTTVKHARDLVPGDTIYDDEDNETIVISIEEVAETYWTRLQISGDHSFIADGLTLHNASRFCKPGAGSQNWTTSNTGCWAATSAGATGSSVPGASDDVTCDGNFGGGTIVLAFGGTITILSMTMGAMAGTFDNTVNNNNVTISGTWNGSGSGARTVKLGTATYTLTGNTSQWQFTTATNLTYTASTSNLVFSGATGLRAISSSGSVALSHGNVTFGASSGSGRCQVNANSSALTLASLTITGPNYVEFPPGVTTTITGAFNWAGSGSSQIAVASAAIATTATCAAAASSVASYASFRDMTFTGSPVASNSFNLGNNSGITITAPLIGPSRARAAAGA